MFNFPFCAESQKKIHTSRKVLMVLGNFTGSPSCEGTELSLDGAIELPESLTVSHFNSSARGVDIHA